MIASACLRVLGLLTALGVGYQVYAYFAPGEEAAYPLSGQVRVAGRPLRSGTVRFVSMAVDRPAFAGAFVSNGEYTIPTESGLSAGAYQVQISGIGLEEQDRVNREYRKGLRPHANIDEPLPRRYNYESRIQVEVAPNGGVVGFDFDLN
jgi:hypothetical protein